MTKQSSFVLFDSMNLLFPHHRIHVIVGFLFFLSGTALAQLPQKVVEYGRTFAKSVQDRHAKYIAETNGIPQRYLGDLKALQAKFQQAGDLDGLLAVQQEAKRYAAARQAEPDPFEKLPEMTAEDIVATPEELRKLQIQYVESFSNAEKGLNDFFHDGAEKYRAFIEGEQKALTRAGKIDEAIAVRNAGVKLSESIESGALFASILSGAKSVAPSENPAGLESAGGTSDVEASPPAGWRSWQFHGAQSFSRDLPRFLSPDIPGEITAQFRKDEGKGVFVGRKSSQGVQVGSVLCTWIGKAFVWEVANLDDLSANLLISSEKLSKGSETGPHLQLAILVGGKRAAMLNVPLQRKEEIIRIVRDSNNPTRFALFWPYGRLSEKVELPSDANVTVLVGVSLHNPGESCSTVIQFK